MNRPMRAHPMTAVNFIGKYAAVLLLPMIRNALSPSGGIWRFAIGEAALAATLIALGVLKRYSVTLNVYRRQLVFHSGVIFRRTVAANLSDIVTVSTAQTPISSVLSAVKVTFYAARKRPVCAIYLSKQEADCLLMLFGMGHRHHAERFCAKQLLISAAADSSATAGLLLLGAAFKRIESLTQLHAEQYIIEKVGAALYAANRYLPPIASVAALAMLAGYGTAVVISLVRSALLRVGVGDAGIDVRGGMIVHHGCFMLAKGIAAVTLRCHPLLRIFGRCTLCVQAVGFADERGSSSAVLPAARLDTAASCMPRPTNGRTVRPSGRAMRRAYLWPCIWLGAYLALSVTVGIIYGWLRIFLLLLDIAVAASAACRIYARVYVHRCGYLLFGRTLVILTRKGGTTVEAAVDADKMSAVLLYEGPFDRRYGVATLKVYPTIGAERLKIKNIDKKELYNISHFRIYF